MTKSRQHLHIGLAVLLLLCAASFDWLMLCNRNETAASAGSTGSAVPAQSHSLQTSEGLSQNIRDAIESIRPSLVTISGASQPQFSAPLPPLIPEISDGDFNSLNDRIFTPYSLRPSSDRKSGGTGVIVSEDGMIWTSKDVVRDSDTVNVTLQNGTTNEGKVVFRDPDSGLAMVKIDAEKLPAAVFANAAKSNLADWAIAVALDDRSEPILSAGLISSFRSRKSDLEPRLIRFGFPLPDDFTGCAFVNLRGELIAISALSSADNGHATSACVALDAQSAIELQRRREESMQTKREEPAHSTSPVDDSDTSQNLTQQGKEEVLSKLKTIREFFPVPNSEWTPATIAGSIRNWLASGLGANHFQPHPTSDASESR